MPTLCSTKPLFIYCKQCMINYSNIHNQDFPKYQTEFGKVYEYTYAYAQEACVWLEFYTV